jgi:hypothetical protein
MKELKLTLKDVEVFTESELTTSRYIKNVTRNLRNSVTAKNYDELEESMNMLIEHLAYSESEFLRPNIRFLAIETIQAATWFLSRNKDKWVPKSLYKSEG